LIKKVRNVPVKIRVNEALLQRLPADHPKRSKIEEDLAIRRAGFHGEKTMDSASNRAQKSEQIEGQ
jgi:hypothetical protein